MHFKHLCQVFISLRGLNREKSCFKVQWSKHETRPFLPFWRILLNVVDLGTNLNVFFYFAVMFLLFNLSKSWKLKSYNLYVLQFW